MLHTAYDNRTTDITLTLLDSYGDPLVIDTTGTSDTVRVKIGKGRDTPLLDLSSAAATTNGSSVTISTQGGETLGQVVVRLEQRDVAASLWPGVFDMETTLVDESDSSKLKNYLTDELAVIATQSGNTGLTS